MEKSMEDKKIENPACPHCDQKLSKWSTPSFNFSDGLGWCSTFLYVCFNDECSFFKKSWTHMYETYGQEMGYRYMLHPESGESSSIPVGGKNVMKGDIIDEIKEAQEKEALEKRKKNFQQLTEYYVNKNVDSILGMLLDEDGFGSVRLQAAEHLGEIADIRALEQLLNHNFTNEVIQKKVYEAIQKIHKQNFTMECPYCAEIIKQRAKVCKHCGRELTA
jgi:hypothetical protein